MLYDYIYISTIIHEQTYIYIYICIMYVYLYMMRSYVRLYKYKSAGPGRRQGGARQGREVRNNNSNNNNNIIIHNIIHNLNSNPNHNPNHNNQKHVKNMGQPQKESQSCKVEGFKTTRSTKGSQEMQNTPKMHLF